ncbi:MAG: prolipoprotein diacylglyceryl transferase [Chloroflexota bacterium]|mgnify:CR=1 FL=1|nr:prolipoprotein diacylglyceryl transferase [Chloroflexota bacterium]MDP6508788.1 prolipoprotein diacylglyceryl transferase [Chloroflexota bacterium]MDP6758007.1 prolipoprotein diacylglyceryl transferase [Chloroflexota bacterium]
MQPPSEAAPINPVIEIPFAPEFHIGPLTMRWYGLIIVSGIGVGWWIARRYARHAGITEDEVDQIAFVAIICGVIGTRVLHVAEEWGDNYSRDPWTAFQMWRGGGSVWGSIIGGMAGGVGMAVYYKLPKIPLLEVGSMGLIAGQMVGRMANVVNGEHTRSPSDLPWAFLYTNPNTANQVSFPAHPSPVYEMILNGLILLILIWLVKRWGGSGIVFAAYLFLYSAGRFGLTFLRVDDYYGGLSQAQWISVIAGVPALIALVLFAVGRLPLNVPPALPDAVRDRAG